MQFSLCPAVEKCLPTPAVQHAAENLVMTGKAYDVYIISHKITLLLMIVQ